MLSLVPAEMIPAPFDSGCKIKPRILATYTILAYCMPKDGGIKAQTKGK
jgi:hypothetical protein